MLLGVPAAPWWGQHLLPRTPLSPGGRGTGRWLEPETSPHNTGANTPVHLSGWAPTRSQQQAPLQAIGQLLPRQLLHCEGGPAACRDRGYRTRPGRPRCPRGAAKDSPGDAGVAGPARTCQEGADALHEGVRLAGRVLLQRLRGHISAGAGGPSSPEPPHPLTPSPSPAGRTGCLAATSSSTRRKPRFTMAGLPGPALGKTQRSRPFPSGAAMAEPAGPFHLLRAGTGRFLCYCGPDGAV